MAARTAARDNRVTASAVWLFDPGHRVLLFRRAGDGRLGLPDVSGVRGEPSAEALARALDVEEDAIVRLETVGEFARGSNGDAVRLHFAVTAEDGDVPAAAGRYPVEALREAIEADPGLFSREVRDSLSEVRCRLIRLPYLGMRESDYIYQFRTERERNREVYRIDEISGTLYQSRLCEAIKRVKRTSERSAATPATLDFGPVSYVLPSHFGFCLGVQNAIERAYETLAANPGRRVFMLSELIHNPFVNEDLLSRGLKYLQSDTGEPCLNPETGRPYWNEIGPGDVVVIPAFGATNEAKVRLIEKGIAFQDHDATCMLVEKVWKAARRFGREGYTVLIHGKSEHEETKATFSNSSAAAPSLIVRNLEDARVVGAIIETESPAERRRLFRHFAGQHTAGFSPERDLDRIAVVNQTTLLRNETLKIIRYLEDVFSRKYGPDRVRHHLHAGSKGDTLCYATQVNQNALERALAAPLDCALVIGGRNSSNTYQLHRMCAEILGDSAFYIQSEANLLGRDRVRHTILPAGAGKEATAELRPFLPEADRPVRILVTGGASCPDGLIQQVVTRINGFFAPGALRSIDEVLADVGA